MVKDHILIIASFLFLTVPCNSHAQIAPKTDSLKTLLRQSTGEQRMEVLHQLSKQMRRSDIDSAIAYARTALEISERIENKSHIAQSHRNLGRLLIDKKNPEALKHLLEAKGIFEQIGDLQKEAAVLKGLGDLYRSQSDYGKTLEYYFSALNLKEQLNEGEDLSHLLMWIGTVHDRMGQPEKSIEFYSRALKISEEAGDASNIAMSATSLGEAYASTGKTEQALEELNKALTASEKLPGAHAKATILISISSVYNNAKSFQQALEANEEALKLARDMSDKMLESLALENIAAVHHKQEDFFTANEYLEQSLPLLQEVGWQQSRIKILNRMARNYFEIDEFEKSIKNGQQAFDAAQKAGAFDLSLESLRLLSEVYLQTGDYEKAIAGQKDLIALKDSSFNREQSRQIADMQTRYETKQKEQEIALLQEEKEKAQLIRNAFIAGVVLIVIIGFLIYNRQRLKIKKNRTDLENTRLKEEQLKQDLEFKNKQLTTHSLNLVQKNEIMKELKENIEEIKQEPKVSMQKELNGLEHLVDYSFNLDEDWEEFKLYFEEVHTGFFESLKRHYPDLTPNELRLSALVKLNLTTKEIATIMGITSDSVKTARYRLRKKLDMETEENLTEFMMSVEKGVRETGSRRQGEEI